LQAAVLGCCAGAVLAGCSAGASSAQSTASSARTLSAPASTPATESAQVLARQAYLGMWQAFFTAGQTADYQYQSLDHYAAGAALELLVRGLYQDYTDGIVTRGQPSHDVTVTMTKTSEGTPEAEVADCSDSSGTGTYYKSGKPAPGEASGRQLINASMQPFDGTWKATTLVVKKAGTC
jgi:hypothetical protein